MLQWCYRIVTFLLIFGKRFLGWINFEENSGENKNCSRKGADAVYADFSACRPFLWATTECRPYIDAELPLCSHD